MKDVGGYVSDYRARTELYRSQNREVRLHECRSACTLALSLPNVCVYPASQLKFHQAYNAVTKETDHGVSDELWRAYPQAVRARLGTLTRQYQVIRGSELIALGVRDCSAPSEKIMLAKARQAPLPATPPAQAATGPGQTGQGQTGQAGKNTVLATLESTFGSLTGGLFGAPAAQPKAPDAAPRAPAPPASVSGAVDVPMPPPRPPLLGVAEAPKPSFERPIAGSQPILPARFVSLAMAAR